MIGSNTAQLFAALLWLASVALAADAEAWKSRTIYFVLTDRIARHSKETCSGSHRHPCQHLDSYCGGTFAGLESQLDYIQGMGFDAIWITPVVANTPGGYHGYWASDLLSINEHYGTPEDLKSLVNAAHDRDMFVMVDVVANHMGYGNVAEFRPAPFNRPSSYHNDCEIDYNNQSSVEQCWIYGLPDLKTTDPTVRAALYDWVSWLVQEYSFDGLRIDTVKHVEKDFWPGFARAAGVFTMGEVWDGNPDYLAPYAGLMDGLLDYAIYWPMNRFYQQQARSSRELADMHDRVGRTFPDPAALGTFLDNHDNTRWLNEKNDVSLLQNALAYVILSRGIPIVYYGTEQGFHGGRDPANREDLWRSGYDRNAVLYRAIARLTSAKKRAGGLADDDQVSLVVADGVYAWSRAGGRLIVVTTNFGWGYDGRQCVETGVAGRTWQDVFFTEWTYTANDDGRVCVRIINGDPVVLLPVS
ncbi:alpha-amylase A type-1/2 [Sodiomyces alkalinus F11]|uniref:Alpha-amylase A type-1/2 n=1 Tax=Sodiomyces alkalinus (strain CBS 110278 / VKM F-3762 / F11) TaxID=1314773 RepID=A0A3N2PTK6_SODAK|nr:alpha-amylase A type-1/2 [Sodiomyces alkalinus F11]ROT37828.1 alpha-amylase A type-1/2 [Sodiomyces alkalinus F11]